MPLIGALWPIRMKREQQLVVGSLALIAVAVAVVIGVYGFRLATGRGAATTGAGGRDMAQIASQKELAAALKDPATREAALQSLRERQDVSAIDMLASLSHKSSDPDVRAACLTALGDIGDEKGLHVLTIGCRDGEPQVRIAGIRAIARLGSDTAHSSIATALTDIELDVRKAAAQALGGIKGASVAAPALCAGMAGEENVELRGLMATALGNIEETGAREALISALANETDASVRAAVVHALGAIADDYRVKGVTCAIGDAEQSVRAAAKQYFSRLTADELPALRDALESPELLRTMNGRQGGAVIGDILDVLEGLQSAATAESLVRVLEITTGGRAPGDEGRPQLRDRAATTLAALGDAAIAPIAEVALVPHVRLAVKTAAAGVLAKCGGNAVVPIADYVARRKVLPSTEEAGIWSTALKRIGGPGATATASEVRKRDPAIFFKQFAAPAPPPATRPPAPQKAEYAMVLHGGVYPGNPATAFARRKSNLPFVKGARVNNPQIAKYVPKDRCSVMLDLVRLENGWDRVVGHPGSYYNSTTFGRIERMDVTDTDMNGEVRITVGRDPWMLGGYGEYTVSLKRQENGSYRGTYKGRYRDVPIEGIATCSEKPKRQPLRAGFRPIQPGERPRLLFRKDELPRLRAKLNTPFGRAAFQRMAMARYIVRHETASYVHVALGLLYQLTGDASYAMKAIPMVEREMADRDFGFMGLGQVWGGRFSNIAMAYDMCYDAWPAEFRAKVDRYLVNGSYATSTNMGKFSSCANTHPCSNYFSPIVGGGSMMALAYWMDPGSAPAPPGGTRLLAPAILKARPGAGVPVTPLQSNGVLSEWLWSGPIYLPTSLGELTEVLGDLDADPIRDGRAFKLAGEEFTFRPPEPGVRRGDGVYPWIAIQQEKPGCTGVAMALYTVIDNVRAGYYSVHLPGQGLAHCSINGTRLPNKAYVHLEAGLYPLLLLFTGDAQTVVGVGTKFRFITDSRKEIDVLVAEGAEKAKGDRLLYELDMADHKATGMDGAKINTLKMTLSHMYRSHRLLMGSGGFQSEGESYHHTAIDPVRYTAALWNVFGQTLSPYPDYTHGVARYIAQGVLFENEKRGTASLTAQSFNGGGRAGHFLGFTCPGFAFTPEEYKPAMLWLWNRLTGVDENDPESYVNLVNKGGLGGAIYTFVNYPIDPKTGKCSMKPVHPNESFPRTWQAGDKGLYIFRNQWKNTEDIVLQVYANELMSKGHGQPDAAGLRLHGLGYDWTPDSPGKGTPNRWLQNVVVLPPDTGMKRATGRVTSRKAEQDGSGRVSIDLDLVYAGKRGHDAVGVWPADLPEPGAVRGLRAVAADYSGKCGAPALFVLVDRVEGGGERAWVWNLPGYKSSSADGLRVETGKNTFTVHQGKASLRAVFVTPGDVEVEAPGTINVRDASSKEAQKLRKKDKNYRPDPTPTEVPIAAKAKPGESFFVVMTLQEGAAPEVTVENGEALDSVVRVGGRTIRFDGENVVVEDG